MLVCCDARIIMLTDDNLHVLEERKERRETDLVCVYMCMRMLGREGRSTGLPLLEKTFHDRQTCWWVPLLAGISGMLMLKGLSCCLMALCVCVREHLLPFHSCLQ